MTISQFSTRFSGQLVYGDPIVTEDHATVVPVSRVRAGTSSPVGIFVIREDAAEWVAATDDNRIALVGVLTGLVAATLGGLAVLRKPPWPDLRISKKA